MSHESKKSKNSTIEEITVDSWEEFEEKIKDDYQKCEELKQELESKKQHGNISNLLFRGQRIACWTLETTLDRYLRENNVSKKEYSWKDYWEILKRILPDIVSKTPYRYELPNEFDYPNHHPTTPSSPQDYEFMIHLRHMGFPSPLLDWTQSHYIAAFFAFQNVSDCPNVAIFSFLEFAGKGKTSPTGPFYLWSIGHHGEGHHPRHRQQQAEYTHCFKKENNSDERIYWSYEEAEFGTEQNILKKYIIPSTVRKKVLEILDNKDINYSTLFGNEESLMNMLAHREIGNCPWLTKK